MNTKPIEDAILMALAKSPKKEQIVPNLTRAVASLFPKFEQIAFYTPDIHATKMFYRQIGCTKWTDDTVTAEGQVGLDAGKKAINVANLAFNYELGTELELITYACGQNWHQDQGRLNAQNQCREPFLSHMSYHVPDMVAEIHTLRKLGFKVIQDVRTLSHTNPYLLQTHRKYRYVIFDTRAMLGFDVKLIQRIEQEPDNDHC